MFNPVSETLSDMLGVEKVAYRTGSLPKQLKHMGAIPSKATELRGVGGYIKLKGSDPARQGIRRAVSVEELLQRLNNK